MKWSSFAIGFGVAVLVYKFGAGVPVVSTVRGYLA